jgi:hypothetical protein
VEQSSCLNALWRAAKTRMPSVSFLSAVRVGATCEWQCHADDEAGGRHRTPHFATPRGTLGNDSWNDGFQRLSRWHERIIPRIWHEISSETGCH